MVRSPPFFLLLCVEVIMIHSFKYRLVETSVVDIRLSDEELDEMNAMSAEERLVYIQDAVLDKFTYESMGFHDKIDIEEVPVPVDVSPDDLAACLRAEKELFEEVDGKFRLVEEVV